MMDTIIHNAKITTLDRSKPAATAVRVREGKFAEVGDERDVMVHATSSTQVIDAGGRRMIPGLIDSHIHVIRGGLNYNMELRWDGMPSLADAMRVLKEQVARTPPPQWVRVVGGFSALQFPEKRLPTLDELNAVAPDTPVFILHLYDRALLNRAALRAIGYTRDTPNPPAGEIVHDAHGDPTGVLLAAPNAMILYSALARGPKLPYDYQRNSTQQFMRELNRLGITSVIDAGGGFQNYPEDYQVIADLHERGEMTVRIAYNLFTQKPSEEMSDFRRWVGMGKPGDGDAYYRHNGGGEMLVFSAADFEDFRQPRPDLPAGMEGELEEVVRLLVQHRWPFRLHATYDESIGRMLDAFEKVNRDVPFDGLHWFFDHAETATDRNLERIARLGGGIAIQDRMAFQGDFFVERYGAHAAQRTPPLKRMREFGIHVGAGTDATRVSSYDPWTSLYWLVTGRTVSGLRLYPAGNCFDREEALRLYTEANTWFSNEEGVKGQIRSGQLADLALLSDDYFSVPEEEIRSIVADLTMVGGEVVHGGGEFHNLAPDLPAPMPDWSPVATHRGYHKPPRAALHRDGLVMPHRHLCGDHTMPVTQRPRDLWGPLGCACWAF